MLRFRLDDAYMRHRAEVVDRARRQSLSNKHHVELAAECSVVRETFRYEGGALVEYRRIEKMQREAA